MKIIFEDKSFIEIKRSNNPNKIFIIIQAKDQSNPLKKITNSVEITEEEFKSIISEIS